MQDLWLLKLNWLMPSRTTNFIENQGTACWSECGLNGECVLRLCCKFAGFHLHGVPGVPVKQDLPVKHALSQHPHSLLHLVIHYDHHQSLQAL